MRHLGAGSVTGRVARALAVVLLAILLLPGALAAHVPQHPVQPMLVEVESPRGLFSPLGTHLAVINITVKIDCTLAQSDAPINFTARDQPSHLFIKEMPGWHRRDRVNNYTGYSSKPCDVTTGYITIKEPMVANFTSYAPAYRGANFTVVVTRGNDVKAARGWLQPGYYGTLQVIAPPTVVRVSGSDIKAELPFRVRNLGNGETTVRLTYAFPTGVRLEAPDVIVLGANPQGGDWDKPLNIRLFLDDVRDDFTVGVNASGFSRNATDPRPATGDEDTTTVDVRINVPGIGALGALAAAAAAVVVASGRRSK